MRNNPNGSWFIIIAISVFILAGCAGKPEVPVPHAWNGVLDLRNWDFDDDRIVELRGQWMFLWKQFADPSEFPPEAGSSGTITVPGYWDDYPIGGENAGSIGWATYGLVILLPETEESLAVRMKGIQSAWTLYVNGKRADSVGAVGTSSRDSIPRDAVRIVPVVPDNGIVRLTLHVSNYHHRNGGMWEIAKIGRENSLRSYHELLLVVDVFLFGFIITMGLHYLISFFMRRTDMISLFFGSFCILIALRAAAISNLDHEALVSFLNWTLLRKIEYTCFYAATACFLSYLHAVFPDEFSRKVLRVFQVVGIVFALFVLVTPPLIFERTLQIYQTITLIGGLYSVAVLILAVGHKRDGAVMLLCGFIFLFILVINDVLYADQILHTGHWLPWGQLVFLMSQAYLINHISNKMFHTVEEQNIQLKVNAELLAESRLGIILGLAKLAEYRDEDTGAHLERIREYCRLLANHLAGKEEYHDYITSDYIDDLFDSSILHDIGKVGVPDAVLLKPGSLSKDEFLVIQKHTTLGGDAIKNVEATMRKQSFLTLGKEIAYNHHEKWDGSGYPRGLKKSEIPLSARIVALADVYDALTSKRPYKEAFSHEKTVEIIIEGRGCHFDPVVVDAFLEVEDEFRKIRAGWNEE